MPAGSLARWAIGVASSARENAGCAMRPAGDGQPSCDQDRPEAAPSGVEGRERSAMLACRRGLYTLPLGAEWRHFVHVKRGGRPWWAHGMKRLEVWTESSGASVQGLGCT